MNSILSAMLPLAALASNDTAKIHTAKINPLSPVTAAPRVHFLRLHPGDLLLESLERWAQEHSIDAASIVSAVGSLKRATLRFAGQARGVRLEGPLEVVSLSGTLSKDSHHLHASVSDSKGVTRGGHLTGENRVYTTLELVIGVYPEAKFLREKDPDTGYLEWVVMPRKGNP